MVVVVGRRRVMAFITSAEPFFAQRPRQGAGYPPHKSTQGLRRLKYLGNIFPSDEARNVFAKVALVRIMLRCSL